MAAKKKFTTEIDISQALLAEYKSRIEAVALLHEISYEEAEEKIERQETHIEEELDYFTFSKRGA